MTDICPHLIYSGIGTTTAKAIRWSLPIILVWTLSLATAQADFITYTESATATGTLGSSSFTDTLVTLTVVGNPLNPGLCTGVPHCTVNQGVISVDVSSVGTATFTPAFLGSPNPGQGVVDNNGVSEAGMSVFRLPNGNVGSIVLFTGSPAFATYNVTESIGPITGTAFISKGFAFPTSAGSFLLSSVSANSIFTALSTLTQQGGTLANPVTFTQQGVGQISATIGGLGSEASYEFGWLGGAFSATASVSGANATGSYLFQLSQPGNPGSVIARETLDNADDFTATIDDAFLASGDYVIALLANNPSDAVAALLANSSDDVMFTIDFATPVNGTAGSTGTVPEPPPLTLLAPGLILLFFYRRHRHRSSMNLVG